MSSSNEETLEFRSLVNKRRFDDETLQILQALLLHFSPSKSKLIQFLRSESVAVMHQMSSSSSSSSNYPPLEKLSILDFFVRAFALCRDVESCLAFRYEAFLLRDFNSPSLPCLAVSSSEWLTFAQQSLDNSFFSISVKACENGLANCHPMDQPTIHQLTTLKDIALSSPSATSHSVQAQTAQYTRKRALQKDHSFVQKDKQLLASSLFRDAINMQNERRLQCLKQTPINMRYLHIFFS